MNRDVPNHFDALLDLHLDQLDDEARSELEKKLETDPELRDASHRLGQVLQPLDLLSVAPTPQHLADKVLARVAEERRRLVLPQPMEASPEVVRRFPFGLSRNVIAAAASIVLLASVIVPGVTEIRARANRAFCGNNLASVFRGVSAYQASFAEALPYAGTAANASWLPGTEPDRPFASNSRHVFLLAKGDFGPTAKNFVCPSCSASKPMGVHRHIPGNDFPRACNVTYASMNLAGSRPNLHPAPDVAYLSDANPLFVNGRFDATLDPDRTNSRSHRGRGQKVLFLDGSVKWMTSPVNGADHDNVWLAGNIRKYTGTETPVNAHDAHLVPGYPATDPMIKSEY